MLVSTLFKYSRSNPPRLWSNRCTQSSAHTQPHCMYGSQSPVPFSREDGLPHLPCFHGLSSLAYGPAAAQNPPTCWWESSGSHRPRGTEIPHVAAHCHQLIVSFLTDNFFRGWLTLVQISPLVRTLGAAARQRGPDRPLAAPSPCHTKEVVCVAPTATGSSQAGCTAIRKLWALEKDEGKWIEGSSFWGRGKLLTLKTDQNQQCEQHELGVSNF